MRKQVFYSMLGMAVLFLVNGCQKQAMDPPYITLLDEAEFTIDANGGTGSVEYRVTNPVQGGSISLATEPAELDWVTNLAAASGAVTFNVEVNTAMEERSAKVILSYPQAAETVEFTIKQAAAGKPVIKLASTTVSVTSAGGSASLAYEVSNALSGASATVTNMPEWITGMNVGEKEITFNVSENTSDEARSAELTVSYPNAADAKFTVNQFGASDFVLNENWTVSYAGRKTSGQDTYDVISVVSKDTERYYISVYEAFEFEGDYDIAAIVEDDLASMTQNYGPNWVADFSYTQSVDEPWQPFPVGEYRAIAIGINDDGTPSGLYQLSNVFEIKDSGSGGSEGYNSWIGSWRVEDAEGVGYDLTITAYDEPYYIVTGWQSGLFKEDIPFLAQYDSEHGYMNFISNENLGDVTLTAETGEVECTLVLYGISDTDRIYAVPEIAGCVMGADGSAQVIGYQYTDSQSQSDFTIVSMEFFGVPKTGGNTVYSMDPNPIPQFPLTMTRTAASAGASAKSTGLKPVGMKFKPVDSYKVPFAKLCETGALNVRTAAIMK